MGLVSVSGPRSPNGPAQVKPYRSRPRCTRRARIQKAEEKLSRLVSSDSSTSTTTTTTSAATTMSPIRGALIVLAVLSAACAAAADQPGSAEGYTIAGRIKIDAASAKGFGLPAKTSNTKVILNGGQKVTFARPDGYFAFHNVPAGTHLIEVSSLGYFFSPVRVDISARNPGHIQAALTENRRVLNELVLEPLKAEQYYEVREPFNIMSLLKSPMGLMVGFMVLMVFVMPKMMENIDPEEIKQAQEQMRNSPVPSFSGLLARANS